MPEDNQRASSQLSQYTFCNKYNGKPNQTNGSHRSGGGGGGDRGSPNPSCDPRRERESARFRKEQKQKESRVFEELEKEVENQF